MSKQEKEVHLGDGVLEGALQTLNKCASKSINSLIEKFFDEFDAAAKDFPSDIRDCIAKVRDYLSQQGNEPRLELKTEGNIKRQKRTVKPLQVIKPITEGSIKQQKSVVKIISPDDPNLPPETRVLAARLEGFNEGKDYEYKIAMLALADNNTPKELIVAVRDYIKKREHEWVSKGIDTIEQQYNDKKFLWDE